MNRLQQLVLRVRSNEARCNKAGYYPRPIKIGPNMIREIASTVKSGEIQKGFRECRQRELMDCSREATVLDFPDLFDSDAVDCASWRLKHADAA